MPKLEPVTLEQAMAGILAMLAIERDDSANPARRPEDRRKTEVILADAGLSPGQIAQILGKKGKSVSQTIIRARKRDEVSQGEENE